MEVGCFLGVNKLGQAVWTERRGFEMTSEPQSSGNTRTVASGF